MASKEKSKDDYSSSGFKFKTTADLKVPGVLIDQIVGQEEAVQVIKKAAKQRRHVLLIGDPGTGKSMMGTAMAELLPKEKLVSILAFANPNDENQPLIRIVPASRGKDIVSSARAEAGKMAKHVNVIIIILLIASLIVPWWAFNHYTAINPILGGIMFLTFSLFGFASLFSFILFLNLGKRVKSVVNIPKIVVNNFEQKTAPFFDATGAHAGALLGDVLHDPFQTLLDSSELTFYDGESVAKSEIKSKMNKYFEGPNVLWNEENNYEAVFLPKRELFVLGDKNGFSAPVEVLSANRYDYAGDMIKLTTAHGEDLTVTPEHKVAVWQNGQLKYVEAQKIRQNDVLVAKASNSFIIDEEAIINTYSNEQKALSDSYSAYLAHKKTNPTWGYKRIATILGVSYGRTRWWWERSSAPVPVQTVEWLSKRGLLPLALDNPKVALIAKVLGTTFGDGGIFDNLNGIFLSSSDKEAVLEFGDDLKQIFGRDIEANHRIIEGGEKGHSWYYQNTNRHIIRFFLALGAPRGNKTKIELNIPGWVLMNEKFSDEFVGSFLGNEMSSPIIHKNFNTLSTLEVGVTGSVQLRANRIQFLNDIAECMHKKGIDTTSIYEGKTKNENLTVFRLLISKKYDNVIAFMSNIKINYCKHKVGRLYMALARWTTLKKKVYDNLVKKGMGAEAAMKILKLTPNSLYLILTFFDQHPEYEKA